MNVVLLSDHQWKGGAAAAAAEIAWSIQVDSMRRMDQFEKDHPEVADCWDAPWPDHSNVKRLVFFDDGTDPAHHTCSSQVLWHGDFQAKRPLWRLLRKLMPALFPRPNSPAFAAQRLREALKQLHPDIINVHNLHAAAPWGWGPHLIDVCLEFSPVVWTLHDMWSFTGRCAYNYDCDKFINGCDATCPTPTEMPALPPEKIRAAWEERWVIYSRHRGDLTLVTPSRWLADQAARGMFAKHRIEVIPYGILPQAYLRPHRRDDARRILGIEPSGPVLLVAAFDLAERRKGAEILPKLWQHIEHRPLTIVTMGKGEVVVDDPGIDVHYRGWVDNELVKALVYCAADILLHPAPVDNFPNTILEALACGTPTVAMPVGGVPEIVRPGVSGWLADAATPEALGRAVDRALRDLSLGKDLRESCRTLAEKEYSLELQGRRYFELFKDLQKRR